MVSSEKSVENYVKGLPTDRKQEFDRLRKVILKNLPNGYEETMSYGMVGYVVPHEIYPAGYHCDSKLPLPFVNIANKKHFIALYHMGIYGSPKLLNWFVSEYKKNTKSRLDMGKCCVRFKKMEDIPYELIGKLMTKISVQDWVTCYEKNLLKKSKSW